MNEVSFLDELVKMGGVTSAFVKLAVTADSDPPDGMIDDPGPVPDADPHEPDDASTRLPLSKKHPSQVESGYLGGVTHPEKHVAEQGKLDWYRDR